MQMLLASLDTFFEEHLYYAREAAKCKDKYGEDGSGKCMVDQLQWYNTKCNSVDKQICEEQIYF